jgi:ribosomal protein S12 methylthiotransferase accessory factor
VDVPVATVAVHREGEWPRFAVGSGADFDPVAAARSALAEALQNWMELRAMGPERAAEDPSAIARFADFPTEARSLLDPEPVVDASGLGPETAPTGTEELDAVLARLEDVGLEAFAARLTPPDVERLGFEVVRVLVPDAQPLFTGERFFGERARSVPRELGFRPRLDRGPHPYP